jgi:hypothetical protein
MLHEKGVEAGLDNETADQALRFFTGKAHAQFRVTVPEKDTERALAALAEMQPLPPERAAECPVTQVIRCPECGSTQIEYPQFSRNTIVGALPSIASSIGLVEKDFFCRVCNYTWPPPADKPAAPADQALS